MSRFKLFALGCVVAVLLLWPLPVAAADPDPTQCLPNCYAKNGVSEDGDGTKEKPWKADTAEERVALRKAVGKAVQQEGDSGSLTVVTCDDAGNCTNVVHKYTPNAAPGAELATETSTQALPGDPTESGVPLPLPYLLAAGALLGVTLIGGGVVLRRRALRLSS